MTKDPVPEATVDLSAKEVGRAECAVCGMVVREQPSPRGQVVHREGQTKHLCSLGDLRAYVQAPSPLGKPSKVYVESLPTSFDPAGRQTDPLPWIEAAGASYVVGFQRENIMGQPTASFEKPETAQTFATEHSGRVVNWAALETTSFNQIPE